MAVEERFWRQRSRIEWLKCGDRNTRFFHLKANGRRDRNKITGLLDSDDRWVDSRQGMEKIIQEFFSNLFQTSNPAHEDIDMVLDTVQPRLSPAMSCYLDSSFLVDEVRKAVLNIGQLKAPMRDGLLAFFHQKI